MKRIIDQIHWKTHQIQTNHSHIHILFQKVKAHHISFGNELADYLANQGLQKLIIRNRNRHFKSPWRWITVRAVCNRAKIFFKNQQHLALNKSINNSKFGQPYLTTPSHFKQNHPCFNTLQWSRNYRKELSIHSRDSTRILLAIRTGHDHLRYHLHHMYGSIRSPSPRCQCDNGNQTIRHFLRKCTLPPIVQARIHMRRIYTNHHSAYMQTLDKKSDSYTKWSKTFKRLNFHHPLTFTDPPPYPSSIRQTIQYLIIELYRMATGYRKNKNYI